MAKKPNKEKKTTTNYQYRLSSSLLTSNAVQVVIRYYEVLQESLEKVGDYIPNITNDQAVSVVKALGEATNRIGFRGKYPMMPIGTELMLGDGTVIFGFVIEPATLTLNAVIRTLDFATTINADTTFPSDILRKDQKYLNDYNQQYPLETEIVANIALKRKGTLW